MFGKLTRSRPEAGTLPSGGADWSRHRRLDDAARAYFVNPDIALTAIHGVLGRRKIRGFTLERVVDINEKGASLWQEAAILDDHRLLLWHSEDLAAEDDSTDGPTMDSSVQIVPLESISHIGMRTLVGRDEAGKPTDHGAYLVAATGSLHELTTIQSGEDAPPSARFRQEAFRFSKTVEEDGAGQVARLVDFGRTFGRLVPHAR
jgi:hypothetical protein